MWFYGVVVVVLVVPVILGVFIFGNHPNFRNSNINRIRQQLVAVISKLNRAYSVLDRKCNGHLLYYLNWIVPVLYFALVTFCFDQFFKKTYPILLSMTVLSNVNKLYIYVSILMVYISTLLAIFTDPGKPNAANSHLFPNNQLIFFNNKVCHTCNIIKPARSKHCSVCDQCFVLFDHHCIWINNCVGLYNYKWFLMYLFANINFLVYGGYLCFKVLHYESIQFNLGYWSTIKVNEATRVTGIFVILCFAFSIISLAFTALHLRYIYLGVTTNEADKWSDIEYLLNSRLLYQLDHPINDEMFVERVILHGKTAFISLKDDTILIPSDQVQNYNLKKLESVERDLVNIYDKGFWNNLKERLFI